MKLATPKSKAIDIPEVDVERAGGNAWKEVSKDCAPRICSRINRLPFTTVFPRMFSETIVFKVGDSMRIPPVNDATARPQSCNYAKKYTFEEINRNYGGKLHR